MPHFAVTRTALAWKNAVRQERNDGSWVNDIRPMAAREGYTRPNVIHIPTATENARKAKRVKVAGKMVRRVTYR